MNESGDRSLELRAARSTAPGGDEPGRNKVPESVGDDGGFGEHFSEGCESSSAGCCAGALDVWPFDFFRRWYRRRISRCCSSVSSMFVPQRQQSATISQIRTVMGALQSGQTHIKTSPSNQNSSLPSSEAVGAEAALANDGDPLPAQGSKRALGCRDAS